MGEDMNSTTARSLPMQPEDYRTLLAGLCLFNWCAVSLATLLQFLIRQFSPHLWPHWGEFGWTYNLVLLEFLAVTCGLTLLLRNTAWLDRAPRDALRRLRELSQAVLLLDGLHVLVFFQLTGGLHGPMALFLPLAVLTLYLSLPNRDAHLVNGLLLLSLAALVLGQAFGLISARGMLAHVFEPGTDGSPLFALVTLTALVSAVLVGVMAGARLERAGVSLHRGVRFDPATGLFSREVLERRLPGELARIGRSDSCTALLLIEFRNMGELTPQLDYLVFSEIRHRFADMLRQLTRESGDTCAQFDAKTYAVLLPTASPEAVKQVAQRMEQAAEAISSSLNDDVAAELAIGAATTRASRQTDAAGFMAAAREALVEARQAGSGHQLVLREV